VTPAPRIVLVRHAETEWAVAGKHTGRTDVPLIDQGRERAEQLAPVLAGREFALVLTSPLRRAAETARLAGLADAEPDPDLVEWDYGDYEGRTKAEIRAERPGWQLWRDGAPNGESPPDVAARADRVIARALAEGGDVALVAHGHLLRMVAVRWLEQPLELGARLPLDPGHLAVLGTERELRVLHHWGVRPGNRA
jgi:probable phosphoglycerate mutase